MQTKKQPTNKTDTKALATVKKRKRRPKHGLYARLILNEIDWRSQKGILLKNIIQGYRSFVIDHLGESNMITESLIKEIAVKEYKLAQCEIYLLENPGAEIPAHYIPLSNSKRLDIAKLEDTVRTLSKGGKKVYDLNKYLKEKYG